MNEPRFGIPWKDGSLTDLDFADDIAMLSTSLQHLQEMTTKLQEITAKVGLRISCPKTKIMHSLQSTNQTITIENEPLEQVQHFQYLGNYISIDGVIENQSDAVHALDFDISDSTPTFNRAF